MQHIICLAKSSKKTKKTYEWPQAGLYRIVALNGTALLQWAISSPWIIAVAKSSTLIYGVLSCRPFSISGNPLVSSLQRSQSGRSCICDPLFSTHSTRCTSSFLRRPIYFQLLPFRLRLIRGSDSIESFCRISPAPASCIHPGQYYTTSR